MKVIKGSFDQKPKTDELTVPMVFDAIVAKEDLENYDEAFCIIKSEDFIVENTNYNGRISRIHTQESLRPVLA